MASKISMKDFLAIKSQLKLGTSQYQISKLFGIHSTTVSDINTGKVQLVDGQVKWNGRK